MKQNIRHEKLDYKKLDEVIVLLDKAMPFAKNDQQLDMGKSTVFKGIKANLYGSSCEHKCGTIHCFAGWAHIAKHFIKNGKIEQPKDNEIILFNEGEKLINGMLGLELDVWAGANPVLWKNKSGILVFSDKMAFYHKKKRPTGAKNLSHIRNHLFELSNLLKKKGYQ